MTEKLALSARARILIERLPVGVSRHAIKDRGHWLSMRATDVTASVAGAVLGIHPYQTPYGLWSLKSGQTSEDVQETSAMLRGTLLEPAAIEMLKRERPTWRVDYPLGHYWRHDAIRIGATPDAMAVDPERDGFGVIQVKSVEPRIFRETWVDPDTREILPPMWIAVQALVEAKLTGASWAVVAVMRVGHGVDFDLIEVPIHEGAWARLVAEVGDFWKRVANNDPPPPDFGKDGAMFLANFAGDDAVEIDLAGDNRLLAILDERETLKAAEKAGAEAEKKRKALDAEILSKMGTAGRARAGDGRVVAAKTIHVNRKPQPASSYSFPRVTIIGEAA